MFWTWFSQTPEAITLCYFKKIQENLFWSEVLLKVSDTGHFCRMQEQKGSAARWAAHFQSFECRPLCVFSGGARKSDTTAKIQYIQFPEGSPPTVQTPSGIILFCFIDGCRIPKESRENDRCQISNRQGCVFQTWFSSGLKETKKKHKVKHRQQVCFLLKTKANVMGKETQQYRRTEVFTHSNTKQQLTVSKLKQIFQTVPLGGKTISVSVETNTS